MSLQQGAFVSAPINYPRNKEGKGRSRSQCLPCFSSHPCSRGCPEARRPQAPRAVPSKEQAAAFPQTPIFLLKGASGTQRHETAKGCRARASDTLATRNAARRPLRGCRRLLPQALAWKRTRQMALAGTWSAAPAGTPRTEGPVVPGVGSGQRAAARELFGDSTETRLQVPSCSSAGTLQLRYEALFIKSMQSIVLKKEKELKKVIFCFLGFFFGWLCLVAPRGAQQELPSRQLELLRQGLPCTVQGSPPGAPKARFQLAHT